LPRRRRWRRNFLSWGYVVFRSFPGPRIEALLVLFSPFADSALFQGPALGSSPRTHLSRRQRHPGDHPPLDFRSPSEFHRPVPPLAAAPLSGRRTERLPLMRSLPLQRSRHPGTHSTRVYLARYVPPSGFLPSRRLASPGPRRPCFMPATLVGLSLQSFSLGEEPTPSSDAACPPAVAARRFPGPSGATGSADGPARLQGLDPLPSPPPSRRLLTQSARAAALLGFSLSRVFPLPAMEPASRLLPVWNRPDARALGYERPSRPSGSPSTGRLAWLVRARRPS